MKKILFSSKFLLSGALLLIPFVSNAHSYWCGVYHGGCCNCGCGGGYAAPLDGGISLLAAAGIGYGIQKFRKNKAKETGK